MKRIILRLKSWQLFTIILLPILMRELFPFGSYFFEIANSIALVIIGAVFLFWLYAVGDKFFKYSENRKILNLSVFKLGLIVSYIYIIGFSFLLLDKPSLVDAFYWVIPIQLVVMMTIVYVIYFVAMVLKDMGLMDRSFFKLFIFIWIFPIGLWWIQPQINRVSI